MQQMQTVCPDCAGNGEQIDEAHRCQTCAGKKVTQESEVLEAVVEKGMRDEEKIVLRGKGDQQPGVEAGDVIIILQQKPHDVFQRHGNDLVINRTVTLTEALCGYKTSIKQLDGRDIIIKTSPGDVIKPGTIKGVKGEGMPIYRNPFEHGNLYIKFQVEFPEKHFTSEENLKQIETILPERLSSTVDINLEDEHTEEVHLEDYDLDAAEHNHSSDMDDDDSQHGGVRCQTH